MNVVVYTKDTCAPCRTVKQWLNNKGIAYTEKDVSDTDNLKAMVERSGMTTVPQIVVNDTFSVVGLQLGLLSQKLGLE